MLSPFFRPVFLLLSLCAPSAAIELKTPQHLNYRVAWQSIPAATASIEVARDGDHGPSRYVVQASATTNSFVDVFWKFRATARSIILADDLRPLRFAYDRTTRDKHEVTRIDFDPINHHARSVYAKREKREERDLDASNLFDPISAAVDALSRFAKVGDKLVYDIFTGEAQYWIERELKVKLGWDKKKESPRHFYQLVKRRFS